MSAPPDTLLLVVGERVHWIDQKRGQAGVPEADGVLHCILDHREQEALGLARAGHGRDHQGTGGRAQQVSDGVALMEVGRF